MKKKGGKAKKKLEGVALSRLEEEDGDLAQVEVDEVTRLVGNVWAKVATDDAMPCWVVFFVEFFLDICGNVLRMVEEKENY